MNSRVFISIFSGLFISLLTAETAFSAGVGTSGGLTLLQTSAARPAALGEAFSSITNDIAGLNYNPGSLGTLETGQASFMYETGLADDSFGHFLIGAPSEMASVGLSVGYYNGGDITIFDGVTEQTVNAQRDLTVGLGFGKVVRGYSFGITGKYISSELIESAKATAYAADFGVSAPLMHNMQLGLSIQNIGSGLKFENEADDLPRIARAGLQIPIGIRGVPTTFLLEAPYFLNEAELRPSAGVEVGVGMLSFRAGYKTGNDLSEFTMGTGFLIGSSSLDYSYGLVDDLDSQHRISLSMRFGSGIAAPDSKLVKKKKNDRTVVHFLGGVKDRNKNKAAEQRVVNKYKAPVKKNRRVYIVKPGDSLAKIARRKYGSKNKWVTIYSANRHLLSNPRSLKVGQKIILP